jgi:multiple sugar transport system ATP-binding protein
VTHDQTEAMGLADRIAVLHAGRIQQIGPPAEVYALPATTFVGGFVGSPPMNFLTLPITNRQVQFGALSLAPPAGSEGEIVLGVRPEDLQPTAAAEGFPFVVRVAEPLGSHIMLTGESAGQRVRVIVPPEHPVRPGVTMHLRPRLDRVVWMDPANGASIGRGEGRNLGTEAAGD